MDFLIADTFTESLSRLTAEEQKAIKTTAFDLQVNPASPGMQFHKLDRAKDKRFWSIRAGSNLRLIVHRGDSSLVLCYAGHHDKAYAWAERRRLEANPQTGAAQLIEIRETVKEIVVPRYVQAEPVAPSEGFVRERPASMKKLVFARLPDEELLGYGVPAEWLGDVKAATEDTLLALSDHLPGEAAEALLELATGGKPRTYAFAREGTSPFGHPDAKRRFRVMTNVEELQRALEFPWEKWTVFLHPEQQQIVERDYSGPARVSGSAGTGKTIVALHRAVSLARSHGDARVLVATFSEALANALRTNLRRLLGNEPRLGERIDVYAMDGIGQRLHGAHIGPAKIASRTIVREIIDTASHSVNGHSFGLHFLLTEWEQVVDAWRLDSWEAYRDIVRLGRKTRLSEAQRKVLWLIFERVQSGLRERGLITNAELFTALAAALAGNRKPVFDFVVVDEAQDLSVSQLRFLAAIGGSRPNGVFFAGDLGQRIFQQPFSWKALGVDIRGRSHTLRVNYRTSHQIRTKADRLLGPEMTDVDGNVQSRRDTISVFNGPMPIVRAFENEDAEIAAGSEWIRARAEDGLLPQELGVFVRSQAQMDRARAAVQKAGVPFKLLDESVQTMSGYVSICTMHLAKGLEFRAVAVMACDDDIIPLQERIQTVGDDADLKEVYDTERQLLYVACTRARDHLLVTGVEPVSEFLDDMQGRGKYA